MATAAVSPRENLKHHIGSMLSTIIREVQDAYDVLEQEARPQPDNNARLVSHNTIGRPALHVPRGTLSMYLKYGFKYVRIGESFGVSARTITRRVESYSLQQEVQRHTTIMDAELDTIVINQHLHFFQDGYDNHPVRTEDNQTPLQLWIQGFEDHSPLQADMLTNPELYGVELGPPINGAVEEQMREQDGVTTIPEIDMAIPENIAVNEIINPLAHSDSNGINIYLQIRDFLYGLFPDDDGLLRTKIFLFIYCSACRY
eukprot:gene13067-14413_t